MRYSRLMTMMKDKPYILGYFLFSIIQKEGIA